MHTPFDPTTALEPAQPAAPSARSRRGRTILAAGAVAAVALALGACAKGTDATVTGTKDAAGTSTSAAPTTVADASGQTSTGGDSSGQNSSGGNTGGNSSGGNTGGNTGGGNSGGNSGGNTGGNSGGGGSNTSPAPVITEFWTPDSIDCHNGMQQTFTARWSTTNATRVTISIDGPGVYKEYGPSGEDSLPFNCSSSHTFLLTAYNADGKTATKQITLQPRNVQPEGPTSTDEEDPNA